ncbi:nucleotidyltransferase domain-containing protein [Salinarimonas sp. NSM]|uniref:nucleotidyltransferase domain-containing protein n=1 Tax=Salinarimonas sp. NSM TaxID=3458003 RepID=UPI004037118F
MRLSERREHAGSKLSELRRSLDRARTLIQGKACVYATGSYGRLEAGPSSDLDLFILSGQDANSTPLLSRLDETLVKASLIEATRQHGISEFDGDGRYLVGYTVANLTQTLGTPEDDVENTFTARLLMLLESMPLLGEEMFDGFLAEVFGAYWRDYEDHADSFEPAFFINDILRLWRTFCVNFEARTRDYPEQAKPKRRLKNFKLKYSRMLTCYSALMFMQAIFNEKGTVSLADAVAMAKLSPTTRLEALASHSGAEMARDDLQNLLAMYDSFLQLTAGKEDEALALFRDKQSAKPLMDEAERFGDAIARTLRTVGEGTRLYRLMIV